jgi:hypothetical protein
VLAGFPDFWVNAAGASTACGTGRRSELCHKAVQGTFALMTPELSRSTNFLRNRYWNFVKRDKMPGLDCVFDSRVERTGWGVEAGKRLFRPLLAYLKFSTVLVRPSREIERRFGK